MKQTSFGSSSGFKNHIRPISVALFVAFSVIALAVGYKALNMNADTRSRAAGDCAEGYVKKSAGKAKICKEVKNKKGVSHTECKMEMQYYCAKAPAKPPQDTPKPAKCERERLCDGDGNCSPPTWKCPPGVTPPVGNTPKPQECERERLCDGNGNCSAPTWNCPPRVTPPAETLQQDN